MRLRTCPPASNGRTGPQSKLKSVHKMENGKCSDLKRFHQLINWRTTLSRRIAVLNFVVKMWMFDWLQFVRWDDKLKLIGLKNHVVRKTRHHSARPCFARIES